MFESKYFFSSHPSFFMGSLTILNVFMSILINIYEDYVYLHSHRYF